VNEPLGSPAHQALIAHVVAHYAGDDRIRAVAVFGSVGAGTWHELSDVDFDVVTEDWTSHGASTPSSAMPSTRRRPWPAGSAGRRSRRSSGSAGR
jgi:hypothetical protein